MDTPTIARSLAYCRSIALPVEELGFPRVRITLDGLGGPHLPGHVPGAISEAPITELGERPCSCHKLGAIPEYAGWARLLQLISQCVQQLTRADLSSPRPAQIVRAASDAQVQRTIEQVRTDVVLTRLLEEGTLPKSVVAKTLDWIRTYAETVRREAEVVLASPQWRDKLTLDAAYARALGVGMHVRTADGPRHHAVFPEATRLEQALWDLTRRLNGGFFGFGLRRELLELWQQATTKTAAGLAEALEQLLSREVAKSSLTSIDQLSFPAAAAPAPGEPLDLWLDAQWRDAAAQAADAYLQLARERLAVLTADADQQVLVGPLVPTTDFDHHLPVDLAECATIFGIPGTDYMLVPAPIGEYAALSLPRAGSTARLVGPVDDALIETTIQLHEPLGSGPLQDLNVAYEAARRILAR